MRRLVTDPLIPGTLWATLAVLTLAAVAVYVFVRPPRIPRWRLALVAGLLLLGLGGILTLLLNPTWEELRRSELTRPTLAVLADTSASMATADCDGRSRLEAAKAIARGLSDDLAADFDVRLWSFDRDLRPLTAQDLNAQEATGTATDLGPCVCRSLAADLGEEAVVVVLSDGIHNVPETFPQIVKAGQMARAMAVPIFTQTLGSEAVVEDLEVRLATPDDVAFIGQTVPVRALIEHQGMPPGSTVEVTLEGGEPVEWPGARPASGDAGSAGAAGRSPREAQRATVTLTGDAPAHVAFPVTHADPGLYRYVLTVSPGPREVVRDNNSAVFYLRVIDEPIRLLVLEGKPYWDFKFLLRQLEGDPGVSVTGAVRLTDGRILMRVLEADGGDTAGATKRTGVNNPSPPRGEGEGEGQGHSGGRGADPHPALSLQGRGVAGAGVPQGPSGERVWVRQGREGSILESYETLKDYHLVILGRDAQAFLTPKGVETLCRWMGEWGGALVCARGRPLPIVPDRLDGALPVRWESGREVRFRVALTHEAELAGWFPQGAPLMPSLATDAQAVTAKALATVVARAESRGGLEGMAVVTYQPYGAGRSVVIEGSGLWRWAFLPPSAQAHRDVYQSFWTSLVRWLVASADFLPKETAVLRSRQTIYTTFDPVTLYLSARNDPEIGPNAAPTIEVAPQEGTLNFAADRVRRVTATPAATDRSGGTGPAGQRAVFRATVGSLPAGAYLAQLPRQTGRRAGDGDERARPVQCAFEVREPVAERLDLRARRDLMARLAEMAGGAVLADRPAEQIRTAYQAYWKAQHPEEFHRTPAWDRLLLLLSLSAVLAALWAVRRRGGLV